MANIILPSARIQQPTGIPELRSEFAELFTSLTLPGDTLAAGYDLAFNTLKPFSSAGVISNNNPTPFGKAVVGNGSTGVLSRAVSVTPQAMWMVASFIPATISTAQKAHYSLGSAAATTGAYIAISSGGNSLNNIGCQFRGNDGGSVINKLGPVPIIGQQTTVVFVCPSNQNSAARIYVNGIVYNNDAAGAANATFTTTLVNESIAALKRGTTANYTSDKILLAGYGLGQISPNIALELSRNPWQVFTPPKRVIYFDLATGEVTGSLIVSETGEDIFAATGGVLVSGPFAATETGNDTFQGSGAAVSTGDLAVTESGSDTFASTGSVVVSGSLSVSETGNDTFASTGSVVVSGSLSVSETGNDTFQGSGAAISSGALAATETGNDTFAATGTQVSTGALAATETGTDTFSASGNVIVSGTLAVSETGNDTFVGVGGNVTTGALNATETGDDTFASTGSVIVSGTLSATEGSDTFSATGNVIVSGTLAVTETGQDTFSSAGGAVIAGTFAATEIGADTFSASGTFVSTGALSATEQSDTFSASGNLVINGALAVTEQSDTFTATGSVVVAGALSASEIGLDMFLAYDSGSAPTSAIADTQWSLIVKEYRKISAIKNTDFRAVVK